jgi:hypothetical protein
MVEEVKRLSFAREYPPIENTGADTVEAADQQSSHGDTVFTYEEILEANPAIRTPGFSTQGSVARTEEDFAEERRRAAEIAERSIVGAAFQEDNIVGSYVMRKADAGQNYVDPEFDWKGYIESNGLRGREDMFMDAMNKTYADNLLADLRRKETNRETLAAAGWAGLLASFVARLVDLPGLVLIGAFLWGRRQPAG